MNWLKILLALLAILVAIQLFSALAGWVFLALIVGAIGLLIYAAFRLGRGGRPVPRGPGPVGAARKMKDAERALRNLRRKIDRD